MKRAHNTGVTDAPHTLVHPCSAIARELHDKHAQKLNSLCRDGVCDVLGPSRVQTGVQSNPRRPRQPLLTSTTEMDEGRENAPHKASERTEVKQVHAIRAQVFGIDPEALELALDLIRPCIAARGPLRIHSLVVGVPAQPLALARCAHLCPGLEARGVEQCDTAARFGVLAPHVEAVVDPPA
jgi:hypothetical protein